MVVVVVAIQFNWQGLGSREEEHEKHSEEEVI